jgi:Domain of unknown function (DUF4331)
MTAEPTITLERDDMQAALLHARPTRYAGAVLLGRIDNRRDGRELLRRLIPFIPTAAGSPEPDQVAWAAVGLSFQGLKAQPGVDGARPVQDGYCIALSGETARFCVHDEQGGRLGGLRVYAGLRSDPFFIDLPAWLESLKTGRLAFKQEGQNSLTGADILGVVVEVDGKLLLKNGGPPLFGVVAETVVDGKLPVRIERFGRPEVKNHILSMKEFDQVNRDLEVRDLYNLEDAFHMSKDYCGVYRARLNANLTVIDRLDGKTDWPLGPDGVHPLTELLLDGYLVVDVSKPFAEDSYFEIERAAMQGRPHETCGARSLNENVMDTIYTLLVNAGNGPRISDGVDRATVPASEDFPYLAPPNPPPPTGPQVDDSAALVTQQIEAPKGGRP